MFTGAVVVAIGETDDAQPVALRCTAHERGCLDAFGISQRVHGEVPVLDPAHQPSPEHLSEVLGGQVGFDSKLAREIFHRRWPGGQRLDDPQSCRVPEDPEAMSRGIHGVGW